MNDVKQFLTAIGPILAYAEIHHKLPLLPNLLNNKLPEIIADAPRRIDRNRPLPVLILVKDSHRFPLELISVKAEIAQAGKKIRDIELLPQAVALAQRLWYRLFEVDPGTEGPVDLDLVFTVRRERRVLEFKNSSYPSVKNKSLEVYVSSDDLPDRGRILYGDLHYHSSYTDDVVEFGAPIAVAAKMAEASGLSFLAVTDHAYDLDDETANPLKNDPALRKWRDFLDECSSVDVKGVTVLPGIEVSAGNAEGKNVHLLILNPGRFYEGKGDSGEVWFKNKPDRSVAEILKSVDPEELPIAAHPFDKIPRLEKWLLRRGGWGLDDVSRDGLAGLQISFGPGDGYFDKTLKRWTEILLGGRKRLIYAGNDAHGDFNRSIHIKTPYLRLEEKDGQIFGFMKTGIYSKDKPDGPGLISLLRAGRCFVTTGPSIFFRLYDTSREYFSGDEAHGDDFNLSVEIKSTGEYGKVTSASIIRGDLATKTEQEFTLKTNEPEFSFQGKLPFPGLPRSYYVRVVGRAEHGMAVSNPVWVTNY